jgi:hypothetical protein
MNFSSSSSSSSSSYTLPSGVMFSWLKAQFAHDCAKCLLVKVDKGIDIYMCQNVDGEIEVITRTGNEPHEYGSLPLDIATRVGRI